MRKYMKWWKEIIGEKVGEEVRECEVREFGGGWRGEGREP